MGWCRPESVWYGGSGRPPGEDKPAGTDMKALRASPRVVSGGGARGAGGPSRWRPGRAGSRVGRKHLFSDIEKRVEVEDVVAEDRQQPAGIPVLHVPMIEVGDVAAVDVGAAVARAETLLERLQAAIRKSIPPPPARRMKQIEHGARRGAFHAEAAVPLAEEWQVVGLAVVGDDH